MEKAPVNVINLPEVVGKGYKKFWNFKGRYRCLKGGRGSKKSCTESIWLIFNMMKMPLANAVVVRRYFNTHRDSTFAQLKWAINRLGVNKYWKCTINPLEMIYLPTGQKIMFRGFDDPQSITSITVDVGHLCWVWIEEAFQIQNEEEFNKLDLSIRGKVPDGYFKQITLTFNPWSENWWGKKRFFDVEDDDDILAITTNYLCNEFLDEADIKVFEKMKTENPRRYNIEGLGEWGIADGLIFNNFVVEEFDVRHLLQATDKYDVPIYTKLFGLDWGFTAPTAFCACLADEKNKIIYIYDEVYKRGLLNKDIANILKLKGYDGELIRADNAEPKSLEELRSLGIQRLRPSKKGNDSIRAGILKLQSYKIIIHPTCYNTIIEFNNYVWDKDKDGRLLDQPINDYNHIMDAFRYACENLGANNFSF